MVRGDTPSTPQQKCYVWAIDYPIGMKDGSNSGIPPFRILRFPRVMIVRPCMSYWNGLVRVVWSKRTMHGLSDASGVMCYCSDTDFPLYAIRSGVILPRKLVLMLCLDLLKMLLTP